jgi:hypothetical protein
VDVSVTSASSAGEISFMLASGQPAALRAQQRVQKNNTHLAIWLLLVVVLLAAYDTSLVVTALYI